MQFCINENEFQSTLLLNGTDAKLLFETVLNNEPFLLCPLSSRLAGEGVGAVNICK